MATAQPTSSNLNTGARDLTRMNPSHPSKPALPAKIHIRLQIIPIRGLPHLLLPARSLIRTVTTPISIDLRPERVFLRFPDLIALRLPLSHLENRKIPALPLRKKSPDRAVIPDIRRNLSHPRDIHLHHPNTRHSLLGRPHNPRVSTQQSSSSLILILTRTKILRRGSRLPVEQMLLVAVVVGVVKRVMRIHRDRRRVVGGVRRTCSFRVVEGRHHRVSPLVESPHRGRCTGSLSARLS